MPNSTTHKAHFTFELSEITNRSMAFCVVLTKNKQTTHNINIKNQKAKKIKNMLIIHSKWVAQALLNQFRFKSFEATVFAH